MTISGLGDLINKLKAELDECLLHSRKMRERYKRIHKDDSARWCYVYLQPKTNDIVKVAIDCNPYSERETVSIYADDKSIMLFLEHSDVVSNIRSAIELDRADAQQDLIMDKLKHNI